MTICKPPMKRLNRRWPASAGLSSRAAAHLRGITSLTAASSTMMRAIESDLLAAAPPPEQTDRRS